MQSTPIKNLLQSLDHTAVADLLHAIGIKREATPVGRVFPIASAFAAGLAIGVASTLLLSPRRGDEVRQLLSERLRALKTKVSSAQKSNVVDAKTQAQPSQAQPS
jgi:hypothetical protein